MNALRRPALAGLTALTLAATMAVTGPATAQAGAEGGPSQLALRLERACLRIPNLELRTERLITRLDGDDSTIGSLAWLESRIEVARSADRQQLTTVLENRLAVRSKTREVLDVRLDELARLEEICGDNGAEL
jgi:hypothetical protein